MQESDNMQILLIHSDYIEYETKRSTPVADKVEEELKKGRMEEALTVFVAVEKNDEDNIDKVAKQTAEEIKKVTEQVKTKRVMIYPYAHLSSSLASPKAAIEALKKLEELLKEGNGSDLTLNMRALLYPCITTLIHLGGKTFFDLQAFLMNDAALVEEGRRSPHDAVRAFFHTG